MYLYGFSIPSSIDTSRITEILHQAVQQIIQRSLVDNLNLSHDSKLKNDTAANQAAANATEAFDLSKSPKHFYSSLLLSVLQLNVVVLIT